MIHALEILGVLALIVGAGGAIGTWLQRDTVDAPLGIGWAFLLGAAFVGGLLHISLAISGTLPRYMFVITTVLCGGLTAIFLYRRIHVGHWLFERRRGWLFDLPLILRWCVCVTLVSAFGSAIVTPPNTYDGRAAFALKARVMYDTGTIHNEDFDDVNRLHFNSHYPLLISLLEAEMFWAEGAMDDTSIRLLFAMFVVSLLTVVTGELRRHVGRLGAALWGMFLVCTPYVISCYEGGGLSSSVDIPFACFATAGIVELGHWLRKENWCRGLTAGLLLGAACLTKSEGTIWLVAIVAATGIVVVWKRKKIAAPFAVSRWMTAVPGVAILLGLLALSTLARREIPFSPYLRSYSQAIRADWLVQVWHRPIEIAQYTAQEYLNIGRWGLVWPCFLGGCLFLRRRTVASTEIRLAQLASLFVALLYFGIFVITPYHLQFHLRTALCRLTLHFFPLMTLAFAEHVHSSGLFANLATLAQYKSKTRPKILVEETDSTKDVAHNVVPLTFSEPLRRKAG